MKLRTACLILAAIAAVASILWLLVHVAVLVGFAVLLAGAFEAGRLRERRRTVPAARPVSPPTRPVPRVPDLAEQPTAVLPRVPRDELIAAARSGARGLWGR